MPEAAIAAIVALDPYGSIRTNRRGQAEHPNYTVGGDGQKAKTGGRISIPGRAKPEQPIAVGLSGLYRVVSFRSATLGCLFSQFGTDPLSPIDIHFLACT